MASTYSELKFEIIATGEQSGTWGNTTNSNIGTAINEAIAGKASVDVSTSITTLPWLNTVASQAARNFVLQLNADGVGAAFELVVPTIHKPYIVFNDAGYTATVKTSAGTGVNVPTGKNAPLYVDGTNVVAMFDYLPSLALGTALPISSGGTGSTSVSSGLVKSNGSVFSSVAAPTGDVVGTTDGQTLTNKIIQQRIYLATDFSGPTFYIDADSYDMVAATAQSSGSLAFGAPTGTPTNGQKLIIRMTASTTTTLSFNTSAGGFRAIGVSLPTSVASGYTTYIGCMWNSTASRWDVLAVNTGV